MANGRWVQTVALKAMTNTDQNITYNALDGQSTKSKTQPWPGARPR